MPQKLREFVTGEIYHIVIRRIGEEELFLDVNDYYRGIFYIYECNTTQPIIIRERRKARAQFKRVLRQTETDQGLTPGKIAELSEEMVWKDSRNLLVEVLAFCFMPNHIHLLVRQLKKRSISKFIQKITSGYAAYFKNKYKIKLKGHFFQDRFTAVHIETEEQLRTVFVYIHTNPIALLEPKWKEKGIRNPERAIKFLEEKYRWSSFFDYIGKKNFPSVTQRDLLLEIMNGPEGCKKAVEDWIKYKREIKEFVNLAIE